MWVRIERIKEIVAKPHRLPFVEAESIFKVPLGSVEYPYSHDTFLFILSLASSQSEKLAFPAAMAFA